MRLRLFCILLAAVSGARGWGYCECRARRQAGLGPAGSTRSAGRVPHRIAAGWSRVSSRPARTRALSSLAASPPRSAMQLRGWRARPGLGLGSELKSPCPRSPPPFTAEALPLFWKSFLARIPLLRTQAGLTPGHELVRGLWVLPSMAANKDIMTSLFVGKKASMGQRMSSLAGACQGCLLAGLLL